MGDEIENGGKLQKEHFCLVKKIGGHICHFVLLDQKSTPCTAYFNFPSKRPQL